jgi:hypothetical protein
MALAHAVVSKVLKTLSDDIVKGIAAETAVRKSGRATVSGSVAHRPWLGRILKGAARLV